MRKINQRIIGKMMTWDKNDIDLTKPSLVPPVSQGLHASEGAGLGSFDLLTLACT